MSNNMKELTMYLNARKARFADVLGERNAGTYIASVLLAVTNDRTGKLQLCTVESIYHSALQAATLRLSVDQNTGQAYLIPFGDKATLIAGYKGLYDLAVRTGKYRYINVGPVYEGEIIIEDRMTGFHKIEGNKASDTIIGWIGAFELLKGYAKTFYMTIEDIHKHKEKFSKGYKRSDSAWNTNTEAMEKKTILRLMLRKWGYMDPADSAALDELEKEQPLDIEEPDIVDIPEDLDEAERETVEQSEQEIVDQLGFE